jgi:RimJ/RimL family protein N-acetyltransferase
LSNKIIFITERLFLREETPEDLDALHEILGGPETMRYYPAPFSREMTEEFMDRSINSCRKNGFGLLARELRETGQFIGQCGITLQNIDGKRVPEIGYHIRKG